MTSMTRRSGRKHARPRGVPGRGPGVHRSAAKAAGGVVCRECGIVEHAGKWRFGAAPACELTRGLCPACRRVRERYPAGTLHIPPHFLARRGEVLRLIRNAAAAERGDHPLERLMGLADVDGHLVVTTTGVHLARKIAHRIAKQFHRRPRFRYADGEDLVHVSWAASAER